MDRHLSDLEALPLDQQRVHAKCYHPAGIFLPFPTDTLESAIPTRFEQQVRRYPDRIAVKDRHGTYTYATLNHMANSIAHALLSQRRGGADPVVLLLEQGAQLLATILGILKSGNIYVPLDPSFPRERLAAMLQDSRAELVVTNTQHLSLTTALIRREHVVCNIDMLDPTIAVDNPELSLLPDTFASILYTSGSTGRPKGVVQNHRNVLHAALMHTNSIHICAEDRLSLLWSCSFSAATMGIFGALLNGAALFPFDLQDQDLTRLATWLRQEAITVYHSIPSLFRHLASTLTGTAMLPALRVICLGGESMSARDIALYKALFPSTCCLVNVFAAGETGVTRRYFMNHETPLPESKGAVGYAVEDKEILLLNEDRTEVARHGSGEIAVRSRYLTPGYWQQPERTQAVILPDTRGGQARIYRTGDLGRILPDGCLEHLGRQDFHVKIRGRQVDLLAIERALLDHPAIKETVVVAREDAHGHLRLIAYVVPAEACILTSDTLRHALQSTFPEHVIPAFFVFLQALPLTPNGKVNRQALPAPRATRPPLSQAFVPSRTPLEGQLAELWAESLGLEEVGIHDSFLELGGHSLLATQILARVIETFHIDVSVRTLLEAQTVADMAMLITQHMVTQADQDTLARLLGEVEALSEEQAQRLLVEEQAPWTRRSPTYRPCTSEHRIAKSQKREDS